MALETVQINFNYDPEVLKEAGVDLDSGTLRQLKDMFLESLREQIEGTGSTSGAMRKRLALIEAFAGDDEQPRDVLTYRNGDVEVVLHGSTFVCTGCGEARPGSEVGLRKLRGTIRNQPQCIRCRSRR